MDPKWQRICERDLPDLVPRQSPKNGGFHSHGGTPKYRWMVKNSMKNPDLKLMKTGVVGLWKPYFEMGKMMTYVGLIFFNAAQIRHIFLGRVVSSCGESLQDISTCRFHVAD